MAITIDGDSGVSGVNGSATTPALQGTDSNTGIVFGTDTVQVATGGSTRATVDSSGHFGLGTTSPAALGGDGGRVLHVAGANNPEIVLERTTSGTEFKSSIRITDSENLTFCIKDGSASANNAMSIDSSGRLLIGNTSNFANANADNLVIGSNSSSAESGITLGSTHASGIRFADSGNDSIGIIEYIHSDDSMRLATNGGERMRIRSNGRLLVQGVYDETTGGSENVNVQSDGLMQRSVSSIKYKKDVETLEDSYSDALLALRAVWYKSKCASDNPDWGYWGFIAEELAEIDPRLVIWKTEEVSTDEDGNLVKTACDPEPEGVQYSRFVPHLLNLIKRQKTKIETLETQYADLLARVTALEAA